MDSAVTNSQIIEDLGSNPITTVKILDWLGLDIAELSIPSRFAKLEYVLDFLSQFPEDTQRFLITKSTRGKAVDKLDHVFEYSHLVTSKMNLENELEMASKEFDQVSIIGDSERINQLNNQKLQVTEALSRLNREIEIYE